VGQALKSNTNKEECKNNSFMPMIVSNRALSLVIPVGKQAVFTKWTRSLRTRSRFASFYQRYGNVFCQVAMILNDFYQ
jgi:hypothetical protein